MQVVVLNCDKYEYKTLYKFGHLRESERLEFNFNFRVKKENAKQEAY